jgi:hypothetical protein
MLGIGGIPDELFEMAFNNKVQGSTDAVCDLAFLNDSGINNIDSLMRFGKDQSSYRKILVDKVLTLQDLVNQSNNLKQGYINSNSNLMSISNHTEWYKKKNLQIKIKSFSISKKKPKSWIKSFDLLFV